MRTAGEMWKSNWLLATFQAVVAALMAEKHVTPPPPLEAPLSSGLAVTTPSGNRKHWDFTSTGHTGILCQQDTLGFYVDRTHWDFTSTGHTGILHQQDTGILHQQDTLGFYDNGILRQQETLEFYVNRTHWDFTSTGKT